MDKMLHLGCIQKHRMSSKVLCYKKQDSTNEIRSKPWLELVLWSIIPHCKDNFKKHIWNKHPSCQLGQDSAGGDDNDPTEEGTAEPARGYHEPLDFYEVENGVGGCER